jgi:hypothetical protein
MTKPVIFISFSGKLGYSIASELKQKLASAAAVTLWPEAEVRAGKSVFEYLTESLTEVSARSDFAVFVLTAEDWDPSGSFPNPNLIFELGFVAAKLGGARTILVIADPRKGNLPSDLAGIMYMTTEPVPEAVAYTAAVIRDRIAGIKPREDRQPVEDYSCFISYSSKDRDFAARLYDDLQKVGVRSWLDTKTIKPGFHWMEELKRAIQAHDKVLIVLSQASVTSSWVKQEVKTALRLERDRQKTVLFPIRLDDAIFNVSGDWIEGLKEKRIGDFSQWHDKVHYRHAFSQLARDLAISASLESGKPS